jgi:hypothetical protein
MTERWETEGSPGPTRPTGRVGAACVRRGIPVGKIAYAGNQ